MVTFDPTIIGADPSNYTDKAEYVLGTLFQDISGTNYQYIKTSAALSPFLAYVIDQTIETNNTIKHGIAGELMDTSATYPEVLRYVGVPQIAIPANKFAWVAVSGLMQITVLASCVQRVALYTVADGADSGCFDDNASGTKRVADIFIKATVGASKTVTWAYSPVRLKVAE